MEKREIIIYFITLVSLMGLIYSVFVISSGPGTLTTNEFILTGNSILELDEGFIVGENISGRIFIEGEDCYGFLILNKGWEEVLTETFKVDEFLQVDEATGKRFVEISDLVDYQFEESGNYELFFSVLELDLNVQEKFKVNNE